MLSTNTGHNLWIGNHSGATGTHVEPVGDWPLDEVERNAALQSSALEYIRANPVGTVALWPKKLAYLITPDHVQYSGPAVNLVSLLYYASLVLAAVLAPVAVWRLRFRSSYAPLMVMLGAVIPVLVFFGTPRFAFPVWPFVALYAAQSIQMLTPFRK